MLKSNLINILNEFIIVIIITRLSRSVRVACARFANTILEWVEWDMNEHTGTRRARLPPSSPHLSGEATAHRSRRTAPAATVRKVNTSGLRVDSAQQTRWPLVAIK